MKFYFSLLITFLICIERVYSTDKESLELEKECEKLTNQNSLKCSELVKARMGNSFESNFQVESQNTFETNFKTKTKSRVVAVFYDQQGNETTPTTQKGDLFNLAMPINTCRNEDCEFCCLSTNRCGTKKQCANSKYYIQYVHGIFFSLCFILITALIIKCIRTDSYPDQMNSEKIDNADLNELINMFSIIRNNRKKLIS